MQFLNAALVRACTTAFALGAACLLSACAVSSGQSTRIALSTEKVSEIQVVFNPNAPVEGSVTQTGAGAPFIVSSRRGTASAAVGEFASLYDVDLKTRFPAMAARYGLTVSPSARAKLMVRFTKSDTACTGSCTTRVYVSADLIGVSGKPIWHFDINMGQVTIFDKIDDKLFDAFANGLLERMKSDGIIG